MKAVSLFAKVCGLVCCAEQSGTPNSNTNSNNSNSDFGRRNIKKDTAGRCNDPAERNVLRR